MLQLPPGPSGSPKIGLTHFRFLTPCSDGVRDFHDFDVDVKSSVGDSVVEWYHLIDAGNATDQRQQLRLAPHDYLPRHATHRRQKARKLNGIAQAMVTTDEHALVPKIFAAPDALQMTRSIILGTA